MHHINYSEIVMRKYIGVNSVRRNTVKWILKLSIISKHDGIEEADMT